MELSNLPISEESFNSIWMTLQDELNSLFTIKRCNGQEVINCIYKICTTSTTSADLNNKLYWKIGDFLYNLLLSIKKRHETVYLVSNYISNISNAEFVINRENIKEVIQLLNVYVEEYERYKEFIEDLNTLTIFLDNSLSENSLTIKEMGYLLWEKVLIRNMRFKNLSIIEILISLQFCDYNEKLINNESKNYSESIKSIFSCFINSLNSIKIPEEIDCAKYDVDSLLDGPSVYYKIEYEDISLERMVNSLNLVKDTGENPFTSIQISKLISRIRNDCKIYFHESSITLVEEHLDRLIFEKKFLLRISQILKNLMSLNIRDNFTQLIENVVIPENAVEELINKYNRDSGPPASRETFEKHLTKYTLNLFEYLKSSLNNCELSACCVEETNQGIHLLGNAKLYPGMELSGTMEEFNDWLFNENDEMFDNIKKLIEKTSIEICDIEMLKLIKMFLLKAEVDNLIYWSFSTLGVTLIRRCYFLYLKIIYEHSSTLKILLNDSDVNKILKGVKSFYMKLLPECDGMMPEDIKKVIDNHQSVMDAICNEFFRIVISRSRPCFIGRLVKNILTTFKFNVELLPLVYDISEFLNTLSSELSYNILYNASSFLKSSEDYCNLIDLLNGILDAVYASKPNDIEEFKLNYQLKDIKKFMQINTFKYYSSSIKTLNADYWDYVHDKDKIITKLPLDIMNQIPESVIQTNDIFKDINITEDRKSFSVNSTYKISDKFSSVTIQIGQKSNKAFIMQLSQHNALNKIMKSNYREENKYLYKVDQSTESDNSENEVVSVDGIELGTMKSLEQHNIIEVIPITNINPKELFSLNVEGNVKYLVKVNYSYINEITDSGDLQFIDIRESYSYNSENEDSRINQANSKIDKNSFIQSVLVKELKKVKKCKISVLLSKFKSFENNLNINLENNITELSEKGLCELTEDVIEYLE